ncbi:MAG: AIR synthase family protein [Chloroflexi bacterium]|nr:AIR synthase family protein [Chloroflexota bacterium]
MDLGKFPPQLLQRLLAREGTHDPRVVLGPRVGEDAAVIDIGERLLVAKSDPITFATDDIGWYAVQVNANDIACTGGVPMWFLATLLVPESFTETQAEAVYVQVLDACTAMDVALIGGHSEVTHGIDRPLVLGTMLGEVERDRLVSTGGAREGDSIVITKGVAVEGTSVLAREFERQLLAAGLSASSLEAAREYLYRPGISVVQEARVARAVAEVHSMHDPTEGGLATGLREIAHASGMGLAVEQSSIPVLSECEEICSLLNLNPLGLLASGCLIITLPSPQVPNLLRALEEAGINAWEVGQIIAPEEGLIVIGYEGEVPLPEFSRDELARYISENAQG